MVNAPRDKNFIPAILLESSTNPGTVLTAKGDEITGRLLVDNPTGISGAVNFIDLADVPASYSGQELKIVRVNAGATALEFATNTGVGHTIEDEGTPLTQRTKLNFVGAGVTATDDAGNDATIVTITGGAGTGDVVAPATNTGSYIPQWDGANSKTLKDGLAVPAGGLAGLTEVGGKVPYTGANADIVISGHSLTASGLISDGGFTLKSGADHITFDWAAADTLAIYNGADTFAANLYVGLIDTEDKTFTFPNASGTIALTADLAAYSLTSHDHSGVYAPVLGADDNYVTDAEKTALHAAITLDTNADDILKLTTQEVGLQTQAANKVLAGRVDAGTALVPTFRSLVAADIPALSYAAPLSGTQNEIAYFNTTTTIASLAVATYPSLTELSYVKGLSSAIQTQLGGKAATAQTFYIGTTQVAINRASAALTLAGITLTTPDIGTALATAIELGHATDTTIARVSAGVVSIEGKTIATSDNTLTLTNKRITQRVVTTTDDATAVIDVDTTDTYQLSAIANATEFTLSGTPTDGQKLMIRLKDAGVAKGLTWTGFTAIGVTLPTTTIAGKWHYIGCVYNLSASAWHAIAVSVQA